MNKIFVRLWRFSIAAVLFIQIIAEAQIAQTPLELSSFKKNTSHELMMSYIIELKKESSYINVETVGTSVQGRAIPLIHFLQKKSGPKIKVLLFCQQHGNEPSGKEAALFLLKKLADVKGLKLYSNIDLYIMPLVNPDGNEAGKRDNANGEDLNRNHLLLSQPEVLAVHEAFRRIQPAVTLDIHEYAAYRKEFRDAGYFRTADEQFGAPTNLNVSPKILDYSLNELFPYLESELKKKGVIFSNYYKMNSPADTVRASTTSIDDGRQSFAILNTFSFILEGKNGRNMNDELQRRSTSQLAAIESFLSFVNINSVTIEGLVKTERSKISKSKDPVALQMDYLFDGSKITLNMKTIADKDTAATMFYSPKVKLFESVERPEAYVVPASKKNIIELLERNGIAFKRLNRKEERIVEIYTINNVVGKWMENKPTSYVSTTKRISKIIINAGDVIVPLNDDHAIMIAITLEPSSMWGIIQYDEFAELRVKGNDYPVYRITISKGK
jgi:hypothetical protein